MKYISLLFFLLMSCSRVHQPGRPTLYRCGYPVGPDIETPNPNFTDTENYLIIDQETNVVYIPKTHCIAVVSK